MLIRTPVSNMIETSRKPKFFLFNYIQPSVLINLLALFVFLIPAESGRHFYKCHHHYAKSSLFWSLSCSLVLAKLPALYSQVTTRKIISGIIIMITIAVIIIIMLVIVIFTVFLKHAKSGVIIMITAILIVVNAMLC